MSRSLGLAIAGRSAADRALGEARQGAWQPGLREAIALQVGGAFKDGGGFLGPSAAAAPPPHSDESHGCSTTAQRTYSESHRGSPSHASGGPRFG